MSTGIDSKSVNLASIFAPYVAGTTKARNSGLESAGNELSNIFANIIYGTAAAATGIASENADLNTLYAKIGTTQYLNPDNGDTYTSDVNIATGQSLSSQINVNITPTQYSITVYNKSLSGSMTPTTYTYDIPAEMTQFYLKITYSSGSTGLLTITDHESWTALPGSSTLYGSVTSGPRGSSSGTNVTLCNCYLAFGTASAAIFSGNTTFHLETDGSS